MAMFNIKIDPGVPKVDFSLPVEGGVLNEPLSPEALMLFLQKEMDTIDKSIQSIMRSIQDRNKEVKELNSQLRKLRRGAEIIRQLRRQNDDDGKLDLKGLSASEIKDLIASGIINARDVKEALVYFESSGDADRARAIEEGAREAGIDLESTSIRGDSPDTEVGVAWGDSSWDDFETSYQERVSQIEERISDINSNQDIVMIKFQDLMSKRSNRINLITNILKKMNDAANSIVGNMR